MIKCPPLMPAFGSTRGDGALSPFSVKSSHQGKMNGSTLERASPRVFSVKQGC